MLFSAAAWPGLADGSITVTFRSWSKPQAKVGGRTTLRLIEKYPGVVSTSLARHTGQERPDFKINVRKLKEVGLTESRQVGYQLSPRGVALLRAIG